MKKTLLNLLLCALFTATGLMANAETLKVGGTTRTYYPYIPADLGAKRPLLISMHGMNQDAGYQRGMLQIESVADTAKFAVVFPEGIDRGWDIGGMRDINFVLAIIDKMAEDYDIDKNRVYLSGFSMGGMFTYHAMNHIADRIAAFAPISGYPMGGQPFTSSRPVPIIHTHGTSDDVVTFAGVQNALNGWIERNGCEMKAEVTKGYRYSGCTRHQWGPGDENAEVVLIERADKGHWIANDVFKSGEEIWNFCKRYSLENKYPKVELTSPKLDETLITVAARQACDIKLSAEASSDYGKITSVAFYFDGEYVGEATEAPYVVYKDKSNIGEFTVKVVATDEHGNTATRQRKMNIKVNRSNYTISNAFSTEGIIPDGWVVYDGRANRLPGTTGLNGGSRTMAFTGNPVDFNYGLYVNTYSNSKMGYATFGGDKTNLTVQFQPGVYALRFKCCNYNNPDFSPITCEIADKETSEVIATTTVMPTCNIGNSPANPFTGVSDVELTFEVKETSSLKATFYTDKAKGADFVLGYARFSKSAESGIEDIHSDSEAVSTEYYDVTGRRVNADHRGLVLRRTTYSDGTCVTAKALNR